MIKSEEGIPCGIKCCDGSIYGIYGIVVSALSVLGLVIDRRTLYFNFAGGEISLEVSAVVICIPETPLNI